MPTIQNRTVALIGALAATFATVSISAPARAQESTAHVSYADLNLRSHAGMQVLRHRIAIAASRVCGPDDQLMRFQVAACRRETITRAQASIASAQTASQMASR